MLPADEKHWKRIIASDIDFPPAIYPAGKRIPLGWKAFPVPVLPNQYAVIRFPKIQNEKQPVWLRLAAAIDIREEIEIRVFLPNSDVEIGTFDIRYAYPFQPFQIPIDPVHLKNISVHGIALEMTKGNKDAWFFQHDDARTDNTGLQPHLLLGQSDEPEPAFRRNLLSMNSVAPFGWINGCVLDALWEMGRYSDREAILDEKKGIIFENPRTEPKDETFNSIEDFLPFAAIANLYPNHLSVQMALDFMTTKERDDGLILSGGDVTKEGSSVTTEGCYTLAYPMAVMAVKQNDLQLARKALVQLTQRVKYLADDAAVYQRFDFDGNSSFRNWGRGIAWYLLGLVKTYAVLKNSTFTEIVELREISEEFKRAIAVIMKWQNDDGLWNSFIDRPKTGVDTSATAGIALAAAWGYCLELLDSSYKLKVDQAYRSLICYLTPDGFLAHTSNSTGEAKNCRPEVTGSFPITEPV